MAKLVDIDNLDRRILAELDQNARQPISLIAKKVKAPRSVVNYKINRMEREGVIQGYVALLDVGKLDRMIWNVYLKFHLLTKPAEEELIQYVRDHPRVWWAAKSAGSWDFVYSNVVKNTKEFEVIFRDFNAKFGKYILQQVIVAHGEADIISRTFIPGMVSRSAKWFDKYQPFAFDKNDKKVLSILGSKARLSILEIAKKTGLDPKTVAAKIKRLEEEGVIVCYRLLIDPAKIGLCFYKAIVYLNGYSLEKDNDLLHYCAEQGCIFHYERKIGPWSLELEMNTASYEQSESLMAAMKDKYPEFVESYALILVKEEIKGELDLTKFL